MKKQINPAFKKQKLSPGIEMFVSVLEAGFLWRVRVLQGPATRHEQLHRFVRGAGENGKPWLSH
jgi:hypothetical protein